MKLIITPILFCTVFTLQQSYAQSVEIPLDTAYYFALHETDTYGYAIEEIHKKTAGQELIIYCKKIYGKDTTYHTRQGIEIKELNIEKPEFERGAQNN